MNKISIRFFNDREVRAVWDEDRAKWWFSVLDIVGVLNDEDNYEKRRNYWKYLKAKLRKEQNQLGSVTTQFKLVCPDGKKRMSNVMDHAQVIEFARCFPSTRANRFIEWFTYSDETIDGKSKSKAYALLESSLYREIEIGTINGLKQIHAYLFGGLYDFAGQIRTVNIAKGGFQFAMASFLPQTLETIERMPHKTFEQIIDKYVEMNVAHPFREGNGRSTRIWLDLMLKSSLHMCVDWSCINKNDYLKAMQRSVCDSKPLKKLLQNVLTNKVDDREMFMKGIDYSYYYEESSEEIAPQTDLVTDLVTDPVTDLVTDPVKLLLSALGEDELSISELMAKLNLHHKDTFRKNYLNPALELGLIERTIPDKPTSRLQKYRKKKT